jgi:hypothetical protein
MATTTMMPSVANGDRIGERYFSSSPSGVVEDPVVLGCWPAEFAALVVVGVEEVVEACGDNCGDKSFPSWPTRSNTPDILSTA